jgi:hypothetical protein
MTRAVLALLLLGLATSASADPTERPPTPFDRGKLGLGISAGSQNVLGHRYYAAGASVGYYVLDGLEIGIGGVVLFGDGPNIAALTPSVRYVVQPLVGVWPVVPYVGAYYNHWFVGDDIADSDVLGGRVGLLYLSGRLIFGLGVAYEHVISDCVTDCASIYPDVTLGFTL